jgi:hypothetical protein
MNNDQITVTAQQSLTLIQAVLALVKAFYPAAVALGGPAGLAVSAAAALIPLIKQIPTEQVITCDDQQKLLSEVQSILDGTAFSGPEWKPSGYVPTVIVTPTLTTQPG